MNSSIQTKVISHEMYEKITAMRTEGAFFGCVSGMGTVGSAFNVQCLHAFLYCMAILGDTSIIFTRHIQEIRLPILAFKASE